MAAAAVFVPAVAVLYAVYQYSVDWIVGWLLAAVKGVSLLASSDSVFWRKVIHLPSVGVAVVL